MEITKHSIEKYKWAQDGMISNNYEYISLMF